MLDRFVDMTAKRPSGWLGKMMFRNPRGHYKAFRLTLEKLALNPAGVFVSFHGGLTHERTGPDRMLLGMILDELMGWGCMIDQGFIADSMLQAGFKSVRSRTLETDWGPMDLDVGRK